MRAPLRLQPLPHNPLVEAQRPGFCVYLAASNRWVGGTTGVLVEGAQKAHVYEHRWDAQRWADMFGGKVTTVPRHNGYCLEFEVLK